MVLMTFQRRAAVISLFGVWLTVSGEMIEHCPTSDAIFSSTNREYFWPFPSLLPLRHIFPSALECYSVLQKAHCVFDCASTSYRLEDKTALCMMPWMRCTPWNLMPSVLACHGIDLCAGVARALFFEPRFQWIYQSHVTGLCLCLGGSLGLYAPCRVLRRFRIYRHRRICTESERHRKVRRACS